MGSAPLSLTSIADAPQLARALSQLLPGAGVLIVDRSLHVVAMEGEPYERHGYSAPTSVGRYLADVVPAGAWRELGPHWQGALRGEAHELAVPTADGSREYWVKFVPLTGDDGAVVAALGLAQDVTQRSRERASLERRLRQQHAISELSSFALSGVDPIAVQQRAVEIFRETTQADIVGAIEFLPSGTAALRGAAGDPLPAMPEAADVGPDHLFSFARTLEGSMISHDISDDVRFRVPLLEAAGFISALGASIGTGEARIGFIGACSRRNGAFDEDDRTFAEALANTVMHAIQRERTKRSAEEAQAEAHKREAGMREAQRLARMGSWEFDITSGEHRVSEELGKLFEMSPDALRSIESFLSRVHPDDRGRVQHMVFGRTTMAACEFRTRLPSGRERIMLASGERVSADARELTRGTIQDVTDQREAAAKVRSSEQRFRQAFGNAPIGMALIDARSGSFLEANAAFCRLMRRDVQELLQLTFADLTYRDDRGLGLEQIDRLRRGAMDSFAIEKRYQRSDGEVIWADLNVSALRGSNGSVETLFAQLLDITDRKAQERRLRRQLTEVSWVSEIRAALAEDRFELHAQPIVDVASGELVQRELLLRMRDQQGELIAPGHFLPAAERHGVIAEIDRWVVARGAELAARGLDVEINLSGHSLSDPELLYVIRHELEASGAEPSRLVFEITETSLIDSTENARALGEQLRDLGCRFALDDFGAGYGGFHYLRNLPLDFIKVDREFVTDLTANHTDRHLIEAVVGLARGFDLQVIAEGVEDEKTLRLLRELGVHHAQGFHIGRPAPL